MLKEILAIREQYERAIMFYKAGLEIPKEKIMLRTRFFLAAVYFARSICEIIDEAAKRKIISLSRKQLDRELNAILPHYKLIAHIRIHDFHRGLIIDRPVNEAIYISGPICFDKAPAGKKRIVSFLFDKGVVANGEGINLNRPLMIKKGKIFDQENKLWVTLEEALRKYLEKVPELIKRFDEVIKPEFRTPSP